MDKLKTIRRLATWRSLVRLGAILGFITAVYLEASVLIGFDAGLALPSVLLTVVLQGLQMIFLMIANFALFFGPFLIYSRVGLDTTEPGDASWDVKVSDVRGQDGAVQEMRKILKLIDSDHKIDSGHEFVAQGGTRERGVLMSGPPGTGKTMLAKAIASELHLPFISTSGASFAGMFMGMDVLKVLMLSRLAKKMAKKWGGSIVFIDEFDAIGARRNQGQAAGAAAGMFMGGGMMALNMLLVVMDGIDQPGFVKKFFRKKVNNLLNAVLIPLQIKPLKAPKYNIFFMGATNRPEVLDEAITRPGRFGRRITFTKPDLQDRKDIAELYFNRVAHSATLDTEEARNEFASITDGSSPAQIQQILSLALMYAFEHQRHEFNWEDLREALTTVEVGMVEPIEFHEEDALAVARHELGHAIALKKFVPEQKPTRLSIRPRGESLGHLSHSDRRQQYMFNADRFNGLIKVCLASTATERIFYGVNTSGVSGDLKQGTEFAMQMAAQWGMGHALSAKPGVSERLGLTLISWPVGVIVQPEIVRSIAFILGTNYREVYKYINLRRFTLDSLAQQLVVSRELLGHQVEDLLKEVK